MLKIKIISSFFGTVEEFLPSFVHLFFCMCVKYLRSKVLFFVAFNSFLDFIHIFRRLCPNISLSI